MTATATPIVEDLTSTVAGVFASVLEVGVGPDDDFFRMGGTSLGMFALLQRLEQHLDLNLLVTAIMEYPTPRALAEAIQVGRALDGGGDAPVAANVEPHDAPSSRQASRVQDAVLVASSHAASRGFLTWVYQ